MNLDALIKSGRLPWSPNFDVRNLDAWIEYEHPVTGTFTSGNQAVLFSAIGSLDSRITVWAYTCLSDVEAKNLAAAEFPSVADLRQVVDDLLSSRRIGLAMADDLLIRHWSAPDDVGPTDELAVQFLNWVLEVKTRPSASTMLRATLAQMDVATADLVDA